MSLLSHLGLHVELTVYRKRWTNLCKTVRSSHGFVSVGYRLVKPYKPSPQFQLLGSRMRNLG